MDYKPLFFPGFKWKWVQGFAEPAGAFQQRIQSAKFEAISTGKLSRTFNWLSWGLIYLIPFLDRWGDGNNERNEKDARKPEPENRFPIQAAHKWTENGACFSLLKFRELIQYI